MAYYLKLPSVLQKLYLVFYMIKLTLASQDPISSRHSSLPPDSIIVNKEEKQEVKKVLDSCQHCKRYKHLNLIKQKGFGLEANFWENTIDMFALNRVVEFYHLKPQAPKFIQVVDFQNIKFCSVPIALKYSNLEERQM